MLEPVSEKLERVSIGSVTIGVKAVTLNCYTFAFPDESDMHPLLRQCVKKSKETKEKQVQLE